MAWTATVTLDPDKTDVGTATAVWNAGQADQFTYTNRIKQGSAAAFITAAKAAQTAYASQKALQDSFSASLTTALNS